MTEMRYTILLIFMAVCIAGCPSPITCMTSVQTEFGEGADVRIVPGQHYRFLVKDKDGVWFVKTSDTSAKVTHKVLVFPNDNKK